VRPPKRKVKRKPSAKSIGDSKVILPRHIVPNQLNIFTPVGTAIAIVSSEKNPSITAPVVYMWCAQTEIERAAIAIVANTRVLYPKIGFRENTGITSEMMPKKGRARM